MISRDWDERDAWKDGGGCCGVNMTGGEQGRGAVMVGLIGIGANRSVQGRRSDRTENEKKQA